MDIETPSILMGTMLGCIFLIVGIIMYCFPPKRINHLYGYRTAKSMENQQQWDFAQIYAAKGLILFGVLYSFLMIILSLIPTSPEIEMFISLVLLVLGVIALVLLVEQKIKQKFIK